jgi:hypothetical protein
MPNPSEPSRWREVLCFSRCAEAGGREGLNEVMQRRAPPGTPAWYEAMTDRQLQAALRALRTEGREWLIVKQVVDLRVEKRRRRRQRLLVVAGILIALLAGGVVMMAVR